MIAVCSMCSMQRLAMIGEMPEPMGVPKVCLKKDFLYEKTVESKHIWRPCSMSEILRRVLEGKESSDV